LKLTRGSTKKRRAVLWKVEVWDQELLNAGWKAMCEFGEFQIMHCIKGRCEFGEFRNCNDKNNKVSLVSFKIHAMMAVLGLAV
jgi:hypothetical protein